jgi:hypothetical protein
MEWIAKHKNNTYLLSEENPKINDLVVWVLDGDKTKVVNHYDESFKHLKVKSYKIVWCYEREIKLAHNPSTIYMPYIINVQRQTIASELVSIQPIMNRYSEIKLNDDFYLPIEIRNNE